MVNFFSTSKDFEQHPTGVSTGEVFISYKAIFQDVRQAVDNIHDNGSLKEKTVANLEEYVEDNGLEQGLLFNRMRENNTKVFLLTNSGYDYTNVCIQFN
jgi:5'-nucleotidase